MEMLPEMCDLMSYQLRRAIEDNALDLAEEVLQTQPVNVNFIHPTDKLTALHVAVKRRNLTMVRLLVRYRANLNPLNPPGELSPLWSATVNGYKDIAKLLIQAGADVQERLTVYREMHLDYTLLHFEVVTKGREEIMDLLLERGCDVNAVESNGRTALMLIFSSHGLAPEVVGSIALKLLEAGADVNCRDHDGRNILHFAAYQPYHELVPIVELIIDRGASLHDLDSQGRTPVAHAFEIAVTRRNYIMHSMLKEHEAGIDRQSLLSLDGYDEDIATA